MNAQRPMVSAQNVHKRFGHVEVLKGISMEVAKGEVMCLIGPSGSGKSTFLRYINHLEQVHAGRIEVDGELIGYHERGGRLHEMHEHDVCRQRTQIGMVFQRFNLFPHLTALDNILEAPLRVRGLQAETATAAAQQLLAKIGLAHKADAFPRQLSGGQQQRIAIARALAMQPKLMLFDEATSALDPELIGEVLRVMRQLAEEGRTMVIVTHEIQFAGEISDRIVFMDQGKIVEDGPPGQVLYAPQQPRTQAFLSRIQQR